MHEQDDSSFQDQNGVDWLDPGRTDELRMFRHGDQVSAYQTRAKTPAKVSFEENARYGGIIGWVHPNSPANLLCHVRNGPVPSNRRTPIDLGRKGHEAPLQPSEVQAAHP